jgi:hypothetical protein
VIRETGLDGAQAHFVAGWSEVLSARFQRFEVTADELKRRGVIEYRAGRTGSTVRSGIWKPGSVTNICHAPAQMASQAGPIPAFDMRAASSKSRGDGSRHCVTLAIPGAKLRISFGLKPLVQ